MLTPEKSDINIPEKNEQDSSQSIVEKSVFEQFTKYTLMGLIIGLPMSIYMFFFNNIGFLNTVIGGLCLSCIVGVFIIEVPQRREYKKRYRNK